MKDLKRTAYQKLLAWKQRPESQSSNFYNRNNIRHIDHKRYSGKCNQSLWRGEMVRIIALEKICKLLDMQLGREKG